jgi:hypothetical protein
LELKGLDLREAIGANVMQGKTRRHRLEKSVLLAESAASE